DVRAVGLVLGFGQRIAVVVDVGPFFRGAAGGEGLFGEVAFGVVGVIPGSVRQEAIIGAGGIARHVAVAVVVVGVRRAAVGGQLVGVVVAERGARAVDGLRMDAAFVVVVVGERLHRGRAGAVFVEQRFRAAGIVVGEGRLRDERAS